MKKSKLLRSLINREKVIRIYIKSSTKEHGLAIDQTEVIYNHLKNEKIIRILSDLYKTTETDLAFKKILLNEVFKHIYINQYLSDEEKEQKDSFDIFFVPHNYNFYGKIIKDYGNYNMRPLRKIKINKWFSYIFPFVESYDKLKWRLVALFYIFPKIALLFLARLCAAKSSSKAHFKYAIPIDQIFQIKFNGKRSFDFLLDYEEINKKNTIFILNYAVDKDWLAEQKEKGYYFLNTKNNFNIHQMTKFHLSGKLLRLTFMSLVKMLFASTSHVPFLICFVYGMNIFIKWNIIFNQISAENYVYTNQEGVAQILINILVAKHGGATWNYSSFIGGGLLYSRDNDFNDCRHILWAFLNSDHFLAVNRDVVKYYRLHHQKIRNYHIIGNIYSEMVREEMGKINKKEFIIQYYHRHFANNMKIVVYLDTTFVDDDNVFTSYDDAIASYQDMLRLLDEREELLMIVKPSKNEDFFISPLRQWSSPEKGKIIIGLWESLKTHERVYWAGHAGDLPKIMAISDLVITHCMSSPTVEALGARKKAFWYESGDKHRGLAYDKIPQLVIHGYHDLKKRIEYLLYEINDDEYDEYLNKNIKSKIEYQLDGLALTRFRKLICAEKNNH
ncbi:MAG: hypothetical protein KKI12_01265 [Proteobacteria bacterium]|nr:hypothetical protein [Pseudomonadota bacterium]